MHWPRGRRGNYGEHVAIEVCRDPFSIRYVVERYRNVELKLAVDESSVQGDRMNIILGVRNESISI